MVDLQLRRPVVVTRARYFLGILLLQTSMIVFPDGAGAQTSSSPALAGSVSSEQEGPMEGVLVSAKRAGGTITITVVSDAQGRYSFPRRKLEQGQYTLRIRAAGYDLSDPGAVEVTKQKTARLDLKLVKAQDLSVQLTNAEWLMSFPGSDEQKAPLLNCIHCHTLQRVVRGHYNAADMKKVVLRMGRYYEGTVPERPQLLKPAPAVLREYISPKDAEYVSSINLSSAPEWQYPLKTLPRPKGKATRVIVTEYDPPRPDTMPHEVIVDSQGMVWYSDHAKQILGRLEPKTAKFVEYPIPVIKPGFPTGIHFSKFDSQGNIWMSMGAQGGVAKFDVKTQQFQTWSMPKEGDPQAFGLLLSRLKDGKLWIFEPGSKSIYPLDIRSGEWEPRFSIMKDIPKDSKAATQQHFSYDIYGDSQNNAYLTDFYSEYIGKVDATTRKITLYPTPTPDSGPRRGHMDNQDRLWFGEYRGNRIAMFDPKTERFQEWEMPNPFSGPYDAVLDKNGDVWTGGMTNDRVGRLNPKTGEIIEYLLPRSTNIRMVDVDNSTKPATLWIGNNHGVSLIKVEPLE